MKSIIELKQELNKVIDEMFDIIEETNKSYAPLIENFEHYILFVDNLVTKKYDYAEALNKSRELLRKSKMLSKPHVEDNQ